MIGNKHNKKIKNQAGQVLLITIMLLATALTVALSVSFKSTTETQVTKLEEESQKALAAAEAGIEAALKQTGIVDINSLGGLNSFTGDAECTTTYTLDHFVSTLIPDGSQYTFYLAVNDPGTGWGNYLGGDLDVYFDSESGVNTAIELTFISSTNTLTRYLIDPNDVVNETSPDPDYQHTTGGTINYNGVNYVFDYKTQAAFDLDSSPLDDSKIMIARVIGGNTRVAIEGSSALPSPGKTCVSTATSATGATKKVTLLQSYPQIPADFFVTSF